jgi:two-component system, chemotaxis family, protein-glutamate methylesterase/glutaminase
MVGDPSHKDKSSDPECVVVVASSAGGLEALTIFLSGLASDLPAPVLVVQHLERSRRSMMAEILQRSSSLPVIQAKENDCLKPGVVLIAPPDYHMIVLRGTVSLTQTELVHYLRPSADLLFESAAENYHANTIAVVLTGTGQDGSRGIKSVKREGGTVIAQNEETSKFFGMPQAAIKTGYVDFILPLDEIADRIYSLVVKEGKT